jgi:hypothetical protein
MSESIEPHEDWNPNLEMVVKKEGEQSQSLYWIHNSASVWASNRNDAIQIPAIILASVTGFLAATSNLVPPVAIGAMSLIVGILNTINSYYKFAQRSESHKITAQLYLKTYKIIEIELALPVHQRVDASKLLKKMRDTMQHVSEVSPPIPNKVIEMYKKNFAGSVVSKPIIANDLESIIISNVDPVSINTVISNLPKNPVVLTPTSNVSKKPAVLKPAVPWPSVRS